MIVLKVQQNTKEWLDLRRSKIGASDAPIIMEVSPFKTEYQLFMEKCFGVTQPVNAAMTRGHVMEERARNAFEKMTGLMVDPLVVQSSSHDWQIASLDGVDYERTTLVELKCPGKKNHDKALSGIVPEEYYPQLQHQLCVTGIDRGVYFSFDGEQGIMLEVKRDDNYISDMLKKEEIFYKRMVECDAPKPVEKDYVEIFDEECIRAASRLKEIDEMAKRLEEEKDAIRGDLLKYSNGSNLVVGNIKLTQVLSAGRVDYKAVPELKGVDLSQYRKAATKYWRLTIA